MAGAVVRVVDVGQGDCVVAVDRATGDALMMDCPSGGESRALAALQSLEVLRLRVAIVSHQHLDHLGGVYNVVTNVPTEKVKLNPPTSVPADSNEKKKLRAALRAMHGLPRRGISLEQALAGESGRIGCVYWRIMSPDLPQLLNAAAASQPNHASVVLKLKVEDRQMIISSDADGESWSAMDNRGEDLDADILQIPHHGGKLPRSSSWSLEQVIQRVGAGTHVISVGSANPYGHPDKSTLSFLRSRQPEQQFFCTQLNPTCAACQLDANTSCAGSITFEFDAGALRMTPDLAAHKAEVRRLPSPQCV